VRLSQATKLAQLAPAETLLALQQVANCYSTLMSQRRRERLTQRDFHLLTGVSRAADGH
jgi:hypothetical protein